MHAFASLFSSSRASASEPPPPPPPPLLLHPSRYDQGDDNRDDDDDGPTSVDDTPDDAPLPINAKPVPTVFDFAPIRPLVHVEGPSSVDERHDGVGGEEKEEKEGKSTDIGGRSKYPRTSTKSKRPVILKRAPSRTASFGTRRGGGGGTDDSKRTGDVLFPVKHHHEDEASLPHPQYIAALSAAAATGAMPNRGSFYTRWDTREKSDRDTREKSDRPMKRSDSGGGSHAPEPDAIPSPTFPPNCDMDRMYAFAIGIAAEIAARDIDDVWKPAIYDLTTAAHALDEKVVSTITGQLQRGHGDYIINRVFQTNIAGIVNKSIVYLLGFFPEDGARFDILDIIRNKEATVHLAAWCGAYHITAEILRGRWPHKTVKNAQADTRAKTRAFFTAWLANGTPPSH